MILEKLRQKINAPITTRDLNIMHTHYSTFGYLKTLGIHSENQPI
jgi:hypothetical protein